MKFETAVKKFISLFDAVAVAALAGLLAIVVGSILARWLFDVTGGAVNLKSGSAVEAARYMLMILVFAALPRAAIAGLIRVEILTARRARSFVRVIDAFWAILLAGVAMVMSARFWEQMRVTLARGDATQDMELPLYPVYGFLGVAAVVLGVAALARAQRVAKDGRKPPARPMGGY